MNDKIFLSNRELDSMTIEERIVYFKFMKRYFLSSNIDTTKEREFVKKFVDIVYPHVRGYDYEVVGLENIPSNGNAIFVCNHSNSHDFFTPYEVFRNMGIDPMVFVANDDLNGLTNYLFKSCGAIEADRNDKKSTEQGILKFASGLVRGKAGVIYGESTWNLHPIKSMHKIKLGSAYISALAEVPIIPTIIEYVEVPDLCTKEIDMYKVCRVTFGTPIHINLERGLGQETARLQSEMERMRCEGWSELGIDRSSLRNIDIEVYLNHTYLKKFGGFGFTYDSESEARHLYSEDGYPVENEFTLDQNGLFVPGVTSKEDGKKYVMKRHI